MGLINRFLLFIYTLAIALLSLGVIAICLDAVPEHMLWNEFTYAAAQWQTIAIAVVVFLWSIHLLGGSLSGRKSARKDREVILVHGAAGDVGVAVEAVRNMIDRSVRTVYGVRDVKAAVTAERRSETDSFVNIDLRIVIGQEKNVAGISDAIHEVVRQHMEDILGMGDFGLHVAVKDISNAAVAKKQRVV